MIARRVILIPLLLAVSVALSAAESRIYKTVDQHGNPVFTDQGGAHAEEIKVREPMTYPGESSPGMKPKSAKPSGNTFSEYSSLRVVVPEDGATIRSNAGNFMVEVLVTPAPRVIHRVQLMIDGQVYRSLDGSRIELVNVDRGEHTLALQVVDSATGTVLQTGPPINMTLQRYSRLHRRGGS